MTAKNTFPDSSFLYFQMYRPKPWMTTCLFFVWGAILSFVCVFLMADHWAPFKSPDTTNLEHVLARLHPVEKQERRWKAIHVLYQHCGCSNLVLDSILENGPHPDAEEHIVLVGQADPIVLRLAESRGFSVETLSDRELWDAYRLEIAPLLIVREADGQIRYCGGYTNRKRGSQVKIHDLLSSLVRKGRVQELPVYGCAVSEKMKNAMDPLGFKESMFSIAQSIR